MSGESVGVGCGQSPGEEEGGVQLASPVLGKGCECWNAGWEEKPRPPPPPQKVLQHLFKGRVETPSLERGKGHR